MTKWCNTCDHKAYCRGGNDIYTMGCSRYIKAKPMTNEEYLKSCTTEQLAEWISSVVQKAISIKENNGIVMLESAIWWDEWLKQPHTTKEQHNEINSVDLSVICFVVIERYY